MGTPMERDGTWILRARSDSWISTCLQGCCPRACPWRAHRTRHGRGVRLYQVRVTRGHDVSPRGGQARRGFGAGRDQSRSAGATGSCSTRPRPKQAFASFLAPDPELRAVLDAQLAAEALRQGDRSGQRQADGCRPPDRPEGIRVAGPEALCPDVDRGRRGDHGGTPHLRRPQRRSGRVDTLRRSISSGDLPAARYGARLIRVRVKDLDRQFRRIPAVGQRPRRLY